MPWLVVGNGWEFSSEDGSTLDVPAWGVLAILDDEPGMPDQRPILHGKDYYLHVDGGWLGVDFTGLLDRLTAMGIVKVGRTVHERTFMDAIERARAAR